MKNNYIKIKFLLAMFLLIILTNGVKAQNLPFHDNINLDSTVNIIVEFKEQPVFYKTSKSTTVYQQQFTKFYTDLDSIIQNDTLAANKSMQYTKKREYFRLMTGVSVSVSLYLKYKISQIAYVKKVFEDHKLKGALDQSVPLIKADKVWADNCITGQGVVVSIIDSGVDYNHEALGGGFGQGKKVIGGYNFVSNSNDPMDDHGHGTHVAGIIAANSNSIKGVAPNATILAYKVLDSSNHGFESDILAAMEASIDPNGDGDISDHADIVNMSLGMAVHSLEDALSQKVNEAVNLTNGSMIFCISAGNESEYGTVRSPGTAASAITVGSSTKADNMSIFSSKGPNRQTGDIKPDIIAPGSDINSCNLVSNGGGLISADGTSMAAPHISGVCALLKQLHPNWTSDQVKAAIMTTSISLFENENLIDAFTQGAGRVDAFQAANVKTIFNKGSLSFGNINTFTLPYSSAIEIEIKNFHTEAQSYAILFEAFPSGVSVSVPVEDENFTLQPNETKTIIFTLGVTSVAIDRLYSGKVNIIGTVDTNLHLPWGFVKNKIWWVSNSGNDAGLIIGDETHPLKTISKAFSVSNDYDYIILKNGIYERGNTYGEIKQNITLSSRYLLDKDESHIENTIISDNEGTALNMEAPGNYNIIGISIDMNGFGSGISANSSTIINIEKTQIKNVTAGICTYGIMKIKDVVIENVDALENAGGIINAGGMVIESSIIRNCTNNQTTNCYAAGISNWWPTSNLEIKNSSVYNCFPTAIGSRGNLRINNCEVYDNPNAYGLYTEWEKAEIIGSKFYNNGFALSSSYIVSIEKSEFYNNTNGILCAYKSNFKNVLIHHNGPPTSTDNHVLFLSVGSQGYGNHVLDNVTLTDNISNTTEIGRISMSNVLIKNSIIVNNNSKKIYASDATINLSYSNIEDTENIFTLHPIIPVLYTVNSSNLIDEESQFVDEVNNDYNLQSTSPCIDSGDPASDYKNEPMPHGCNINMGAYGNTSKATSKKDIKKFVTVSNSIDYSENFEDNIIDTYWAQNSGNFNILNTAESGGNSSDYWIKTDNNTGIHQITLNVDLSKISNPVLSYYIKTSGTNSTTDGIFFASDCGAGFEKVTELPNNNSWTKHTINISKLAELKGLNVNESFSIMFQYYVDGSNFLSLDEFIIRDFQDPNISINASCNGSVDIEIINYFSELTYNIHYGLCGTETDNVIYNASANESITVAELGCYYFYVEVELDGGNITFNPKEERIGIYVNLDTFKNVCINLPTFTLSGGTPEGGIYNVNGIEQTTFDPSWGAGVYNIVYTYTNEAGCINYDMKEITVSPLTALISVPEDIFACTGVDATFEVEATGTNLLYQWQKDGADIAGAVSATYTISTATATEVGNYTCVVTGDCGTVTSNPATLTVNPATEITSHPGHISVCTGVDATFEVEATGTNLLYQWQKDGADIAGAVSATYTISTATATEVGNYTCVVTGDCGTVTSNPATLTVNPSTVITQQPTDETTCENSNVTFMVVATGTNLLYQWQKYGADIAGAVSATYTIPTATVTDVGNYTCVVTGDCGTVTSNPATLTVNPTTVITVQPQDIEANVGSTVTFSVTATGSNLTYQWKFNGANIDGANGSEYTVTATDETVGEYTCEVTGNCGTVLSDIAELTVGITKYDYTILDNTPQCPGTKILHQLNGSDYGVPYRLIRYDNEGVFQHMYGRINGNGGELTWDEYNTPGTYKVYANYVDEDNKGTEMNGTWEVDYLGGEIIDLTSVQGNEIINAQTKNVVQNITIEQEGTLTIKNNTMLNFAENTGITVKPGGKLVIDNSTLTNKCGGTWKGITVLGNPTLPQLRESNQGVVEITNNAVIENAVCGVSVGNPFILYSSFGGGIVRVNSTTFRNNIKSIEFFAYQGYKEYFGTLDPVKNASYISNSTFEINDEMANIDKFHSFVSFNTVNGVKVKENKFQNLSSNYNYEEERGIGIKSRDANIHIYDGNIFTNLNVGIHQQGTGNFFSGTIINNNFKNNYTSIMHEGVSGADIMSNVIEFPVDMKSLGIYIQNSDSWHIEDNQFLCLSPKNDVVGILLGSNKGEEIYRNKFSNLRHGILVQGENPKLQLICNEFNSNRYHIYVDEGGSLNEYQGYKDIDAGNTFLPNCEGSKNEFYNASKDFIYYFVYEKLGGINHPECNYRVGIYKSETANTCPSTLGGGSIPPIDEVVNLDLLKEQLVAKNGQLHELTDNGSTSDLLNILINAHPRQTQELRDFLIEISPWLSDTILTQSVFLNRLFPTPVLREIFVNNPRTAKAIAIQKALNNRSPKLPKHMRDEIDAGIDTMYQKELLEADISQTKFERAKIFTKRLSRLMRDSVSTSHDSIKIMLENENNLYAKYNLVNFYFSKGETTLAIEEFDEIPQNFDLTNKQFDEHTLLCEFYQIKTQLADSLNTWFAMSAEQKATLETLAEESKTQAGQYAQAVLSLVFKQEFPFEFEFPAESTNKSLYGDYNTNKENEQSEFKQDVFEIYPNPSEGYFVVKYKFDNFKNGKILQLSDISGRIIVQKQIQKLSDEIFFNTNKLKSGVYFVKIGKFTQKIIVK